MENKKERVFSIELKSSRNLKNLSLTSRSNESVVVEGDIGKLVEAKFAEGAILEVVGDCGVLRVDLSENEILRTDSKKSAKPLTATV